MDEELQQSALREVMLTRLRHAHREEDRARLSLINEVDNARQAGCSWDAIADVLGVARQSAMSRFSRHITAVDLRRNG